MTDSTGADRRTSGWHPLPLLALVALLLVAVALVARAGPYTQAPRESSATPTRTSAIQLPPAERPAEPRGRTPEEFSEVPGVREVIPANVLVVAITVGLVVLMGYGVLAALGIVPRPRFRPRATSAGTPSTTEPVRSPELAQAVDQALDFVEHGEAREAVVACWLLMIQAASESGSPARPSETSREYADRLAAEQLVSAGPLARLAELYREARFSQHALGTDLRTEARRSLGVLQTELRSGVRL